LSAEVLVARADRRLSSRHLPNVLEPLMRSAIVVTTLICLTAGTANAADQEPDCDNQLTTYEQQFCANQDFKTADRALNKAYQQALAKIAASDQPKPLDAKSWEAALRTAQRAWVAFREADCKGDVPFGWGGGTGTQTAVLGCMIGKTEQRTEELTMRYGGDKP
jgi:uncharacterized protein YecT (DUF1311 family)